MLELLPLNIFIGLLDFLDLKNILNLITANKALQKKINQYFIKECFRRFFPSSNIDYYW